MMVYNVIKIRNEEMIMKKKKIAPCYQTLLPYVAVALKKFGGKAEKHKVLYQLMIDLDLPESAFDKAKKELGWAGSRLRALEILKPVDKRGVWELDKTFLDMDDELLMQAVKAEHKEALN
jgi:hypothetical protein